MGWTLWSRPVRLSRAFALPTASPCQRRATGHAWFGCSSSCSVRPPSSDASARPAGGPRSAPHPREGRVHHRHREGLLAHGAPTAHLGQLGRRLGPLGAGAVGSKPLEVAAAATRCSPRPLRWPQQVKQVDVKARRHEGRHERLVHRGRTVTLSLGPWGTCSLPPVLGREGERGTGRRHPAFLVSRGGCLRWE
jgi:hypothetical protein